MRTPYKKSTVNDVAALAGVSQSAVSHFINGRTSVCSPETAERIKHAITELHYTPSRAIRFQGRRATNTIGVCVSLPSEDEVDTAYTYLHQFWSGVGSIIDEQSYCIKHFPKSMRNSASCNPFLDGSIDGLLISAKNTDKRIETLADAGLPTVCVVRSGNLPHGVGSVVSNESDVVDLAMSHLWELGHRHIGYLGPGTLERNETAMKRHTNWSAWLDGRGETPCDLAVFVEGYLDILSHEIHTAVDHWLGLTSVPTAIFCFNDRLALAIMLALKDRGLRIPEDMSVVGVDNERSGALFDPPLTSVQPPVHDIGQEAARMLLGMVRGTGSAQVLNLPVNRIVVRSSTCPPHVRQSGSII